MAKKKETPQHSGAFVPSQEFMEGYNSLREAIKLRVDNYDDLRYGLEIEKNGVSVFHDCRYDNSIDSTYISWKDLAKTIAQIKEEEDEELRQEILRQEKDKKDWDARIKENQRAEYLRLKAIYEPQSPA